MPRFEGGGHVQVYDDLDNYLGAAHGNGGPLSSDDALAQLGYEIDEGSDTGVKRLREPSGARPDNVPPARAS